MRVFFGGREAEGRDMVVKGYPETVVEDTSVVGVWCWTTVFLKHYYKQ